MEDRLADLIGEVMETKKTTPDKEFSLAEEVDNLVEEIEQINSSNVKNDSVVSFNRPSLITISSANATSQTEAGNEWFQNGFYSFTTPFPRPALNVESIQLVSSNIPNANQNIPDTACVFWFYRLSRYSGMIPSINNLFFVRLLPSFYKPEWLGTIYGQNMYFQNYTALATQLTKSCARDIAQDNITYIQSNFGIQTNTYLPFIPNAISLTYNSTLNKFQMTGNASANAYQDYDKDITYSTGSLVLFGDVPYISIIDGNIGNSPIDSPLSWTLYSSEVVASWNPDTTYQIDMIVRYSNTLYISIVSNTGHSPDDTDYWSVYSGNDFYYYQSTGYEDPNVLQLQGSQFYLQWNSNHLYQVNDRVQYNGLWYFALQQNVGQIPTNTTYWNNYAWNNTQSYSTNGGDDPDIVLYNGSYFYTLVDSNVGNTPRFPWNNETHYTTGNYVSYNNFVYIATASSTNKVPTNTSYWSVVGSQKWSITTTPTSIYSNSSGLNYLSGQYDMIDANYTIAGTTGLQYPFPKGIPAQPYNPNPQRLLNSILGFCWNGRFSSLLMEQYLADQNFSIPSTATSYFNRFRPVLPYQTTAPITSIFLGATNSPTGAMTYTADTYCNLLYSSIASIYCDWINFGSMDTQRPKNTILAIAPLSVSLAVSSFNNFVDNPIVKVLNHISQINVELRDEFSEPLYLPYSAVVSLTFKLTYQD